MKCRICREGEVSQAGEVEYYSGFAFEIYECPACLCRFTKHEEAIYNLLHSQPNSIYGIYLELEKKIKHIFDQKDLYNLKKELCENSRYKFIIDSLENKSISDKILEIGCSRGYLTSYFILANYQIIGADVSPQAIAGAQEAFGDYFISADSQDIQKRAPYDAIYHVGTIGCVGNPLSLTHHLLNMLKPGGQLLFNAPNADSCWLNGQLWIDAAPPPDLVTLFRPGFWQKHFSDVADVVEETKMCPPDEAFGIGLKKIVGRKWQKPIPLPLDGSLSNYQKGRPENSGRSNLVWRAVERGAHKIGRLSRLLNFVPEQPSPFGLFVKMTKK